MFERETCKDRANSSPRSSAELLAGLPSQMLLNRLDRPTIVIGFDGVVIYANPACERMLGYHTPLSLEGQSLGTLLTGQSGDVPHDWIDVLSDPDKVTNWNHSDGYPIATLASNPVALPTNDLMFMLSLEDVSAQMWSAVDRAFRLAAQYRD
jgi:PAS domain-containing protein